MQSMASPEEPILTVDGLTVCRGEYTVIQDVSFSLRQGDDMAIVGPNGAGKSTLIQAILGLLPYHQGTVTLLGNDWGQRGLSRHQRRLNRRICPEIAYLPQNFLADARVPMSVAELVGLGWDKPGVRSPWFRWKQRQQAVQAALTQVGAEHLHHQPFSCLSGGEMKRVLLAYCLVRPRRLLVLDEAPAGLDVCAEQAFYQLLNRLKQEQGWSILQISHDLERVRQYCNGVLFLNQQLLKQGTPEEVLNGEVLATAYGRQRRWN